MDGGIMWYMGSKNKLSKELVPIIQSYIMEDTKGYIEPFVGEQKYFMVLMLLKDLNLVKI